MQAPGDGAEVDFSEVYAGDRMAFNQRIIDYCRTFVAIISGCAAGILGLTGLVGFLAFLLTNAVLSVGLFLKVAGDAKPFFRKPNDIWTAGISQAMLSYILFWTLFYDIVCANGACLDAPLPPACFCPDFRSRTASQTASYAGTHLLVDGRARTACCRWRNEVIACV